MRGVAVVAQEFREKKIEERNTRRGMVNYACKLLCKSIGRGWEIGESDGWIGFQERILKCNVDAELIVS